MSDSVEIPTLSDWGEIPKDDLDARGAFEDFFGKSNAELSRQYRAYPIGMADSLRWMPDNPFAYYVQGFAHFVMAGEFDEIDAPDIASSFLNLVRDKAVRWPSRSVDSAKVVMSAVRHLASHQSDYHADPAIYGSFAARSDEIERALESRGVLRRDSAI